MFQVAFLKRREYIFLFTIALGCCAFSCSPVVHAAEATTYMLRPHCEQGYGYDNSSPIGEIPAPGMVVQVGNGQCRFFEVQDPQTLEAGPFSEDEIFEFDIVIRNPKKVNITRARAWLDYDPEIFEGIGMTIDESFSSTTPGESDFNDEQGQVRIEAINETSDLKGYWVRVATVQLRVRSEASSTTVISFYDVQAEGHSTVVSGEEGAESDILETEPGALLISIGRNNVDEGNEGDIEEDNEDFLDNFDEEESFEDLFDTNDEHSAAVAGSECTMDSECEDELCYGGICRAPGFKIPTGGSCERDNQCQSLECKDGICTDPGNYANGEACIVNADCQSKNCNNGFCETELEAEIETEIETESSSASSAPMETLESSSSQSTAEKLPIGSACIVDFQCETEKCTDGACAEQTAPPVPTRPNPLNDNTQKNRTAFGLIQVRGLEITTEGGSVFLRWSNLDSSDANGYNVYYGTTKGQYIQRKTVPESENTITIRNLPAGNRYYFAVRGISKSDEESAFSDEVTIVIGDPDSSSNPLVAAIITKDAPPKAKPIRPKDGEEIDLPGETGLPSPLLLLVGVSALAGTFFAGKRQLVGFSHPHE